MSGSGVTAKGAVLAVGLVLFVLVMGVVGVAGCKSFNRYQRRADAHNRVQVTAIEIQAAKQRVKVTQQEAKVRLAEAIGIRHAQDEISATLTDKYLQHEAIKAQAAMANSQNHTQVYVPSGQNGIPLVQTGPDPNATDSGGGK